MQSSYDFSGDVDFEKNLKCTVLRLLFHFLKSTYVQIISSTNVVPANQVPAPYSRFCAQFEDAPLIVSDVCLHSFTFHTMTHVAMISILQGEGQRLNTTWLIWSQLSSRQTALHFTWIQLRGHLKDYFLIIACKINIQRQIQIITKYKIYRFNVLYVIVYIVVRICYILLLLLKNYIYVFHIYKNINLIF